MLSNSATFLYFDPVRFEDPVGRLAGRNVAFEQHEILAVEVFDLDLLSRLQICDRAGR